MPPQLIESTAEINVWQGSRSAPIGTPNISPFRVSDHGLRRILLGVPFRCVLTTVSRVPAQEIEDAVWEAVA